MNLDWESLASGFGIAEPAWERWALALVVFLALVFLRRPLAGLLLWPFMKALPRFFGATPATISSILRGPFSLIPIMIGLSLAGTILQVEGLAVDALLLIIRTLALIALTWALARSIGVIAENSRAVSSIASQELRGWAARAISILVWFVGAAAILELWGVRVTPLIASLGIVGVAVALGAQDFFRNLISGLVVLSEKRYRIGDRIQLAGVVDGGVEQIGFRSTRVRLFDGAPVSVPNALLSDGALVNYGEIPWRRVSWHVTLEYRTTAAQLRQIRDRIHRYISDSDEFVSADETSLEVRVDRMADSSIDILIYAFANTTEWSKWLETKENLIFEIMEAVEEAGASFAFPSRSIYIENQDPGQTVS